MADGNRASVGDVIITRRNDRRLRLTATDWVKNGDRWTITHIGRHGELTVRHNRSRLTVRLPADYVRESTGLGYATTIHTAQGISADTMHGLATAQESRQQLYTMLTRGRAANHLYLQVVGDGDPHSLIRPDTVAPRTPTELLQTDSRPRRHADLSHHTAAPTQSTQPSGCVTPSSATPTGSMWRPSSSLDPRSSRCSTAKPTRSSLNSPANRRGRPSEHACSLWRRRPVTTHSSTCTQPPPVANSTRQETWPPCSTGASQTPQPPTQDRCPGFPAYRQRFMIIPFGAGILPSVPS